MENEDLELEQRVWQRIGGGRQQTDLLESLIRNEEECAAVSRHLAARESGSRKSRLLAVVQQSRENAGILKGMLKMSGGQWHSHPVYQPQKEKPAHLLGSLTRSCMELEARYESMSHQGEFCLVCRDLAERKNESLEVLLTLMGE